jgi:hypothetical protein
VAQQHKFFHINPSFMGQIETIYGLFGWRKGGQFTGFGTEDFLKKGRQLSSIKSGQN